MHHFNRLSRRLHSTGLEAVRAFPELRVRLARCRPNRGSGGSHGFFWAFAGQRTLQLHQLAQKVDGQEGAIKRAMPFPWHHAMELEWSQSQRAQLSLRSWPSARTAGPRVFHDFALASRLSVTQ
ncbi:unnamed protein product [Effrenium voratum]|nr:unnamed protein product [Effrenium voratum]